MLEYIGLGRLVKAQMLRIKNITKQVQVFQIKIENSAEGFEGSHQSMYEYAGEGGENKAVRKRIIRHGPVIRLRSGEDREVPACIVRDPSVSNAIKQNKLQLIRVEAKPVVNAPKPDKSAAPSTPELSDDNLLTNKNKKNKG